jgi:hypothetical protein
MQLLLGVPSQRSPPIDKRSPGKLCGWKAALGFQSPMTRDFHTIHHASSFRMVGVILSKRLPAAFFSGPS